MGSSPAPDGQRADLRAVTIMRMKKAGLSAEKAGAVEVAAGSNGKIMPPVMGAAAF
jgi:TRAP-type uncharacterized transport system fused permease subunit